MNKEERELLTAGLTASSLLLSKNGGGATVRAGANEFHGDNYARALVSLYKQGLVDFKNGDEYGLTDQGQVAAQA